MSFDQKDDRNYTVSSPVSLLLSEIPGGVEGKNSVELCGLGNDKR